MALGLVKRRFESFQVSPPWTQGSVTEDFGTWTSIATTATLYLFASLKTLLENHGPYVLRRGPCTSVDGLLASSP